MRIEKKGLRFSYPFTSFIGTLKLLSIHMLLFFFHTIYSSCSSKEYSCIPIDHDLDGFTNCEGDCDDDNPYLNLNDFDEDGFSTCTNDCDDDNPYLTPLDEDNDGFSTCDLDCDDTNSKLNLVDADNDGLTSCDGDCDDENEFYGYVRCHSFVEIEAGTFTMGSPDSEKGRSSDEKLHTVILTHDFFIMDTEVTQEFFEYIVGYNPSYFSNVNENHPVESINWHTAAYACNLFSEAEGYDSCYNCTGEPSSISCVGNGNPYECNGYRLPTEAEWEFAARSGTTKSFWTPNGGGDLTGQNEDDFDEYEYSGTTPTSDCSPQGITLSEGSNLLNFAWYCGNNQVSGNGYGTKPVGSLEPNAWGLYDMHGNVYEWVHDSYAYYPTGNINDPYGCDNPYFNPEFLENNQCGQNKVQRGGHWGWYAEGHRSASRKKEIATTEYKYAGFRMARTK